jgi:hypothetical protein
MMMIESHAVCIRSAALSNKRCGLWGDVNQKGSIEMPLLENFSEFCERMNCEYIVGKKRFMFRNGARSDGHIVHEDPPEDEFERLAREREFLQTKLDRKIADFNEIQTQALDMALNRQRFGTSVPGPHPNTPHVLRRIQGIVFRLRDKIAAIDKQLNTQPVNKHLSFQDQIRAEQIQDAQRISAEVQKVRIGG